MQFFKKFSLLLLCILCCSCEGRGLHYEHDTNPWSTSIHVLVVDPKQYQMIAVKAQGEEVSRETVASLVHQYGAIAGVNGGFWKLNGTPAGILKIQDHWYGTPIKPRGAIGWSADGKQVLMDRLLTNVQLKEVEDSSMIEVLPAPSYSYTTAEEWKKMDYIVGGTPLLISRRHVIEDYSCEQTLESFLTKRYPRTAIGIRENGDWVFVVVDVTYALAGGMTIKELADYMHQLGCIDALNLDGGSSSTMVIDGKVINNTWGEVYEDGKHVQAISDAILIMPKENPAP